MESKMTAEQANELVDTVAYALYRLDYLPPHRGWDKVLSMAREDPDTWGETVEDYRKQARAAISAVRRWDARR